MNNENILEILEDARITKEFIERDLELLGIQNGYKAVGMNVKESEKIIKSDFYNYDGDIILGTSNPENIILIEGQDKNYKDITLIYYSYNSLKKENNTIVRQLRRYNYKGDLEEIQRDSLNSSGRYFELDEGSIKYAYDENGIKKYAKIDDPFVGEEYVIYDKNGSQEIRITDEYINQRVVNDDKEYHIIDGYILPGAKDGNTLFRYRFAEDDLGLNEIKRVVYGNISEEEKNLIEDDLDDERKKQVLDALDLKYHLEWFVQEIDEEIEYSEDVLKEEEKLPSAEEVVEESIKECVEELRESGVPYTFEQFIKESKTRVLGEKRPMIICKDGTEYSIQASSTHYCTPREDGLEEYEEFEIGNIEDWITDDLKKYDYYEENVASCVPKKIVEKIIKTHGGLDKKIMKKRIKEQQEVFKPKDEEYEKMIKNMFGDNEFFVNIFRYASRKYDLTKKEEQAKELLGEYEDKNGVSRKNRPDNIEWWEE